MTLEKIFGAVGAFAIATTLLTPGAALSQEAPPTPPAEVAQAAPAPIPTPAPKPRPEKRGPTR